MSDEIVHIEGLVKQFGRFRALDGLDLDVERFLHDLDDEATAARVRADVASAEASGARGTPTFFVNGRRHVGPHDAGTLAAALEGTAEVAPRA